MNHSNTCGWCGEPVGSQRSSFCREEHVWMWMEFRDSAVPTRGEHLDCVDLL